MAADRGMGPADPKAANAAYARLQALAKALPGVEEGGARGWREFRVRGKPLAGVRGDGQMLLVCADGAATAFLLETRPTIFWQAPHYVGTAWVIARPDKIDDASLFAALEASWRAKAPKRLVAAYEAKPKPALNTTPPQAARTAATRRAPAQDHFARVVKLASTLPAIEIGASYGTPALKANNKFLCRIKEGTDGESLVVIAANQDEKEFLLESDPEVFWQTPHYHGHTGLLVHLAKIDDKRLFTLLEAAWKRKAGKRALAAYERANKP